MRVYHISPTTDHMAIARQIEVVSSLLIPDVKEKKSVHISSFTVHVDQTVRLSAIFKAFFALMLLNSSFSDEKNCANVIEAGKRLAHNMYMCFYMLCVCLQLVLLSLVYIFSFLPSFFFLACSVI